MNIKEFIKKEWSAYENLISFAKLEDSISRPCKYIEQELRFLIPSIELAADGPVVRTVFLFTDDYLSEVRLSENSETFDFTLLRTVVNYRIELGSHEVKPPEVKQVETPGADKPKTDGNVKPREAIIYQTAKILLSHFESGGIQSAIEYVGNNRENWLSTVLRALPVNILKP
jgi:hypothetical protein